MRKRGRITSISTKADDMWILDAVDRLARLEHLSFSEIMMRAAEEYVKKHAKGNPQKPLFPSQEPWVIPMVERRRENLEWLESIIRHNPGVPLLQMVAKFSQLTGLKRDTVMEYVKTLEAARIVKEYAGKLYAVDTLPSR